jgi:hypothetical protein
LQGFLDCNETKNYYSYQNENPEIPQVMRLDILRFHKLGNNEHTYEDKDEENLDFNNLYKDHTYGNENKPGSKGNNCSLLFSHENTCKIIIFFFPVDQNVIFRVSDIARRVVVIIRNMFLFTGIVLNKS